MKIKICGITHPEDARLSARLGADFVGVIFCERSRRNVSLSTAKKIADATRAEGAEPVGVFVDQPLEQIRFYCAQTGIRVVQLHGAGAKEALEGLLGEYSILYTVSVEQNGSVPELPKLPSSVTCLYDHAQGGTGETFSWKNLPAPETSEWLLAGGLNPENIAEAIALLKPGGVDVSTGVEIPGTARKDPLLLEAFIRAAKKEAL